MKRTKIVATIGPSSETYDVLLEMAKSGMNVCRLNFSHGTHKNHLQLIKNIRKVQKKLNLPITILQDLQGPKIRISDLPKDGVRIEKDKSIFFYHDKVKIELKDEKNKFIPVSFPIHMVVKKNDRVLVHDGMIELKVMNVKNDLVQLKVVNSGTIFSRKGINIPHVDVAGDCLTKKDIEDLKFGLKNNVDWVALSFLKSHQDILKLRKVIQKNKANSKVKIIAKIEKPEAVKDIDEIIKVTDGIMIARGDLGVEIKVEKVPIVQKNIITKCIKAGKPVVVATQMLESMVENRQPTRAEVSDVANAVIDHTDAVMLSGETAYGKYPIETVKMMSRVIKETEDSPYDNFLQIDCVHKLNKILSISESVENVVLNSRVKIVVVKSKTGFSARMIARFRPETPIMVFSNDAQLQRQLNISWGIKSYNLLKSKNDEDFVKQTSNFLKKNKFVKSGELVVFVLGKTTSDVENVNTIRLHKV